MKTYLRTTFLIGTVFLLAACVTTPAANGPGTTGDSLLGPVLVDAKGMTLYTYDGDLPDKPNCAGLCSLMWPSLEAAPDAQAKGDFTIVNRASGTRQWEYKRKPLYSYQLDSKPGDVGGEGKDGTWHAAKP
jgi:predicted lipoprotein with Yx(FWY)xxD motif